MYSKIASQKITLLDGRTVSIETGRLARQAHGSAIVTMEKAMLLATVVEKEEKTKGAFLPLSVDYQEKFSSAGKIPGGFFKRESRPNEYEIITSRLVDRAIRPLFPKEFFNTVQVIITLISSDKNVASDSLAILAASSALMLSPLPFCNPVAGVRVGKIDDVFCINPTPDEIKRSAINITIAGTKENILMLEGSAQEIQESELIDVIKLAHKSIKLECEGQMALAAQRALTPSTVSKDEKTAKEQTLAKQLQDTLYPAFYSVAEKNLPGKQDRVKAFSEPKEAFLLTLDPELVEEKNNFIEEHIAEIKRKAIRDYTIHKQKRIDGRKYNEVRPINITVDYLPSAHGSAIFERGDTQVLATLTLGGNLDAQCLDGVSLSGEKRFIVNYNFPPFSTGEAKAQRGPARREIGHGNLVSNALKPMLPNTLYTLRLTAETFSSDGSSSMASICSGTLTLMDAGIKLKKPVSGIAMGLIFDKKTNKAVILSDILSEEDACGDADFKIAGTQDGITACQMDIKTEGMSFELLEQLLLQAKESRLHILSKMNEVLDKPRLNLKPQAPVISEFQIKPAMIGSVIGPRGKTIQDIQQETGASVNINDEGLVSIFAPNSTASKKAYQTIQLIIAEPEVAKIYKGTIKSLTAYGAFVEFLPGKEGLLHVTEMSKERVKDPSDVFKVGQEVEVKLISIIKPKEKNGRTKFSLSVSQI